MAKESLTTRIHESDLLWAVCRAVGYVGFPFRNLFERLKPLVEKHGTRKVSLAIGELLSFTGWVVALKPEVRKACFSVLGPAPEQYDSHYRDWQGSPTKRPPEHETIPDVPQPTTDPFLDSLVRLTPEELIAKHNAMVRLKSDDDRKAVESEMLRLAVEVPKVEAPTKEEPNKKELPKEEDEEPTVMKMDGLSPEAYAREAREGNRRELLCMLRDARKKLAHHGKKSFAGKEAKKAITAAEDELKRREFPIPPEGEETAEWDRKKEDVKEGA